MTDETLYEIAVQDAPLVAPMATWQGASLLQTEEFNMNQVRDMFLNYLPSSDDPEHIQAVADRQFQAIETLVEKSRSAGQTYHIVWPFMFTSLEAVALGAQTRSVEKDPRPTTDFKNPLIRKKMGGIGSKTVQDLDASAIEIEAFADSKHPLMQVYLETLKRMGQYEAEDLMPVAYITGPVSLFGRLTGDMRDTVFTYTDVPDKALEIVDGLTGMVIKQMDLFRELGIKRAVVLEPLMDLTGLNFYRDVVVPHLRRIGGAAEIPWWLHDCTINKYVADASGNDVRGGALTDGLLYSFIDSIMDLPNLDGLSYSSGISLAKVHNHLASKDKRIGLIGNVDFVGYKTGGIEGIKSQTEALVADVKGKEGIVYSSACEVPPDVPRAALNEMRSTVRSSYG